MLRAFFVVLMIIVSLFAQSNTTKKVWQNKLDPVYMLPIDKYPKFSAEATLKNGKTIKFCCVKSLFNFYFHPEKYPTFGVKNTKEIASIKVQDYLSGKIIDAKDAFYVFGSRLMGPHGDDLIPLSSKTHIDLFQQKYGGTKVIRFGRISYGLIHYLDM